MLNVTVQQSPEAAKSYFAKSDYYAEGQQEINGSWGGKGATLLGLFGRVDSTRFNQLCDNINPRTGQQLTAISRTGRRTGYDFTWSAPKSASVVHALTGDERIVDAFRSSVRDTMEEIEQDMQARVRKDGQSVDRKTGNIVYAEFVHLTSRPVNGVPYPQLHVHSFCQNATYDPVERQWKAGQFAKIKSEAYYWQAVQQSRFANNLQSLGYQVRKTKDAFEIDGVPKSALDKLSQRTAVIERVAAALGITDPKRKAKLAATTREAKNNTLTHAKLVSLWRDLLTTDERHRIEAACGPSLTPDSRDEVHARFAADHLFERSSVLDNSRLLTLAMRHGVGEVTPEGIRRAANRLGLLTRHDDDKVWVTRRDILAEESQMIRFAASGRGTCRPIAADPDSVQADLRDTKLSDEQRAAVIHVLSSTDRVMILRGGAGTGKTTLTTEAVRQMERAGRSVVMLAPSAQASRGVLRSEGFDEADTLSRFLIEPKMQDTARQGVVWLDEAGLVGTRTMAAVLRLAENLDARVVLAGDNRQMASVERGAALRLLETVAGLKVAEIETIRRQSGRYRDAIKLLSHGKVGEGVASLNALGWVKPMPKEDKYRPLAQEYVDKLKATRDRENGVLVVCPTHAAAAEVTKVIRSELRKEGLIDNVDREFVRLVPLQWSEAERADVSRYEGGEILQFHRSSGPFKAGQRVLAKDAIEYLDAKTAKACAVYGPSVLDVSKGDVIRVTANGHTKDRKHRLNNGASFVIDGFTPAGDIRLANSWIVDRTFGQFNHGYISTAHGSQGRTVQHVLISACDNSIPAVSQEALYVAASRGRKSASIWVEDYDAFLTAAKRSNPRTSATELVSTPSAGLWQRTRGRLARLQIAAAIAAKSALQQIKEPLRQRGMSYER